ncbi:BGTF surface domain-containing protein [Halobaculum halobium]|uniref:BGTF surface domain-containing protein n=1 Tax=Halobaculum halobium TaxID=3032281 RepID=A0ABD5TE70_9EURY|nr:BGTF surface domain-containing protein [Halobaculum sp. SYNS20]
MKTPSTIRRLAVAATLLLAVGGLAVGGFAPTVAAADDASLSTVNDTVRVHAVEGATVRGTAGELDAGSTVSVRVQSAGDTSPRFFKSADATVAQDGTFAAEFDLSGQSPGNHFSVTVSHNGTTITEATGRVVPEDEPVTATPSETATQTETTGAGFGAGLAVSALAVAAGLARRRRA